MTLPNYTSKPMSLPSINFLHLTVSEIEPGQDFKGLRSLQQGQRSTQSHTMILHTKDPLTNVHTKYQLPTSYGSQDIAQTRF